MPVKLNGATSGYVQLSAPAVAGTTSLELPTDSIQPALVYITSGSLNAATTLNVDNCFTSRYENYKLLINGTLTTASTDMWMRFRSGGTTDSTSNYNTFSSLVTSSSTIPAQSATAFSRGMTFTTTSFTDGFSLDWTICRPQTSTKTEYFGFCGRGGLEWDGGSYGLAASFDGFSLIFSTAFTGIVRVYGIKSA